MNAIKVQQVTKMFGDFKALDDVSLSVEAGEIFGFIGPNGAGKSTTIRTMLGLLKPTSGQIQLFEKDAWKDAVAIHQRLAYVPGDVNLWPNLTGGETIDLLLSMQDVKPSAKKEALIKRFDLDPTKKARSYSKGNRQKVALIAAFASDADLFILDEPTAGLDPLMERAFQEILLELKKEGKTILLSSHLLAEVEKVCDRVAIIRQGKIIETGSLEEMRHLTRMKLIVETREPLTDLPEWEGVHDSKRSENTWTFYLDAIHLDTVMRKLSSCGILKLESTPPSLEDLFLRHYDPVQASDEEV